MTPRAWRRGILRATEVLAAATLFLILTQLHKGIVQYAFTMFGARTDAPMILAVNFSCGRPDKVASVKVPPAWSHMSADPRIFSPCQGDADVEVVLTVPVGRTFVVFLNDQIIRREKTDLAVIKVDNLRLRPGVNRLTVADEKSRIDFPVPADWRPLDGHALGRTFSTVAGLRVPHIQAPHTAFVVAGLWRDASGRVLPSGDPMLASYGPFKTDRGLLLIRQGPPGLSWTHGSSTQRQQLQEYSLLGDDGLFVDDDNVEGNAKGVDETSLPISRDLTIADAGERGVELSLSACLPSDHPLVSWSEHGQISAAELIRRSTGYSMRQTLAISAEEWQQPSDIKVLRTDGNPCVLLQASFTSRGELWSSSYSTSFLRLPRDTLTLSDSLAAKLRPSLPANAIKDGNRIWRGRLALRYERGAPRFERLAGQQSVEPSESEPARADAPGPTATTPRSALNHWQDLSNALPRMLRATLWSLAHLLPVGLIYWALRRQVPTAPIRRALMGAYVLLAFMAALTLQPILFEFSRTILDLGGLWALVIDNARIGSSEVQAIIPVAFIVALMTMPILLGQTRRSRPTTSGWRRVPLGVMSVAGVVAAVTVAICLRWIVNGAIDQQMILPSNPLAPAIRQFISVLDGSMAAEAISVLLVLLVLAWCLIGLLGFWISLYWLARAALMQGSLGRPVCAVAALFFCLPLITPTLEAIRLGVGLALGHDQPWGPAPLIHSAAATVTTSVVVVIMVTVLLRAFRQVTIVMLEPEFRAPFRSWSRTSFLILIAILLVGPTTITPTPTSDVNIRAYQFMVIFLAYGSLLVLLGPWMMLRRIDRSKSATSLATRFDIDGSTLTLLAAAFAGYLGLWAPAPIGVPVLIAISWLIFTFWIVVPAPPTNRAQEAGLADLILKFRAAIGLLESRQKTYEKRFTEGKIDVIALAAQRNAIDVERINVRKALGLPLGDAKARLLGFGPGNSPFSNGLIGALAGLVAALLLQIVLPIDFHPSAEGKASGWANILAAFVVDPSFRPVDSTESVSRILSLVSEILNALTIWVLLGFLFGFLFHRIRGEDGFVKALVFGLGIAVTFLVGQALVGPERSVSLASIARVVPILVFLMLLGALVFDGQTLRRQGVPMARLPELYGLKASLSYASIAGAVAATQPILALLDWLFSRSG
jgi:hypothetical protein